MDNAKDPKYYANKRLDLIKFVPQGTVRVIEVGCGTGATGAEIKRQRAGDSVVIGVELNPQAAAQARRVLDTVFAGDVERLDLPFPKNHFDCIIYGDVLEHLLDPWGLLARHKELLKPGGLVIASIPNAGHYRIVRMLKRKEWSYAESGIMDVTHLRFFAVKSIYDMFSRADLEIAKMEHIVSASRIRKILNRLLSDALIDDITEQYIVVARKP